MLSWIVVEELELGGRMLSGRDALDITNLLILLLNTAYTFYNQALLLRLKNHQIRILKEVLDYVAPLETSTFEQIKDDIEREEM